MKTRSHYLAALSLGLLALTATSCLNFQSQEIRYRYDARKDRLDALLIYRGLYAQANAGLGTSGLDIERDADELDQLLKGKRRFCLLDWPFDFDLEKGDVEENYIGKALKASAHIRPGTLWQDDKGRLCGYQLVRIAGMSNLLGAANKHFSAELTEKNDEDGLQNLGLKDPQSMQMMRQAAEKGYAFFATRRGRFEFSIPVTDAGAAEVRSHRFSNAGTMNFSPKGREDDATILHYVMQRDGDLLRLVLEPRERPDVIIRSPARKELPNNLVAPMEARGWRIKRNSGDTEALRAYESFCAER